MNPEQLSTKGTESGHQKALFAWAAMAEHWGFEIADNMEAYNAVGFRRATFERAPAPIPHLHWMHCIPNGGLRDARTAALMKAEGLRSGIADIFLPIPRKWPDQPAVTYCGLYIEMKKPSGGVQSPEQKAFEAHCHGYNYLYRLCKSWREAADVIKEYLL